MQWLLCVQLCIQAVVVTIIIQMHHFALTLQLLVLFSVSIVSTNLSTEVPTAEVTIVDNSDP